MWAVIVEAEGGLREPALDRALRFWRDATRRTGLPSWPIVRIQARIRPSAA